MNIHQLHDWLMLLGLCIFADLLSQSMASTREEKKCVANDTILQTFTLECKTKQ